MATNELTCQELVALVTDYLEDALTSTERMRFEDHLMGCTGCRHYLEQMRRTIATTGHLREDDLPVMARDDLLAVFRTWKQDRNDA